MSAYEHNKQVTFVHIPKNAGTSVIRWMEAFGDVTKYKSEHYTAQTMKVLYPESKTTFTVVRNPWDRVVSMYHFVQAHMALMKERYGIYDGSITFDSYCRFGIHSDSLAFWYRPTSNQVEWFNDNIDHVLHYENLDKEFDVIRTIYNSRVPLPRLNTTTHDDYRSYYTNSTRNIIGDLFEDDVKRFNYDF
jgi:hypothetical protein